MRRKIVAANWKMNKDLSETETFLVDIKKQVFPEDVAVMIGPAFTNLYHAFQSLREHPIEVIAQNMNQNESGAFTGEISAKMLQSVGVQTVILGHSERREYFNEDNSLLSEKVNTALEHNMGVIFCIGENQDQRKKGKQLDVIKKQLSEGLFHIKDSDWEKITIAYEPVWAIGTGETASPDQVQEMHAHIRRTVADNYSEKIAEGISILYGGSVKPDNAGEIFANDDVDGGLIGGASLKVKSFMDIIKSLSKHTD